MRPRQIADESFSEERAVGHMITATVRKYFAILMVIVIVFWGSMLLGGYGDELAQVDDALLASDMLETPTMQPDDTLTQTLPITQQYLSELSVHVANGNRFAMNYVVEGDGQLLAQGSVDQLVPETRTVTLLDSNVDVSAYEMVTLRLTVMDGNDVTLFYGNMIQLARGMVAMPELNETSSLTQNG